MRTETAHFWVGNFKDEDELADFFGEDAGYYDDEDESEEDEKSISEFAKSQNEIWIDHDFFECGFEEEAASFEEQFENYSYAEEWISELKLRAEKCPFPINAIAFINKEEIKNPVSVSTDEFELMYLGEITYNI